MFAQTLVPTSAQWLTSLDIENVAAALNGPPLTFLKFFVSDHRKIQQLRDEYSLINSATPGAESSFYECYYLASVNMGTILPNHNLVMKVNFPIAFVS